MSAPAVAGEDAVIPRLLSARSKLASIVSAASAANESLMGMDGRLSRRRASAASAAVELAPLQSQAISAKALESRINRAVPPALAVLRGFSMVEALQSRLASMEEGRQLAEYVETVDRLHAVVGEVTAGCEAAVQRLQEAVEFVSRTKAAERGRTRRMREAVGALRALWEGEVEAMRYDGLLDRALVRLQDEFHGILQNMRHPLTGDEDWDSQTQLLARIAQTLAGNDCLDICIDIFVKVWKAGFLSQPEPDESLLRDAVLSLLDALQRNVEAKRAQYKDKVVGHVFTMNSYWYMYMRTRGSELAALVGEETMRRRYKVAAEEAAYAYQAQAWGPLVEVLEREDEEPEAGAAVARGKMEAFMRGFDENLRRHRNGNICIPDVDLREQIGEAVTKLVAPAYNDFLRVYLPVMQGRPFLPSDSIPELLAKFFDGGEGAEGGHRPVEVGRMSVERSTEGGRRVFRNQAHVSKGRVFRTANLAADPNN